MSFPTTVQGPWEGGNKNKTLRLGWMGQGSVFLTKQGHYTHKVQYLWLSEEDLHKIKAVTILEKKKEFKNPHF